MKNFEDYFSRVIYLVDFQDVTPGEQQQQAGVEPGGRRKKMSRVNDRWVPQ